MCAPRRRSRAARYPFCVYLYAVVGVVRVPVRARIAVSEGVTTAKFLRGAPVRPARTVPPRLHFRLRVEVCKGATTANFRRSARRVRTEFRMILRSFSCRGVFDAICV